jgi:hypothetical protein
MRLPHPSNGKNNQKGLANYAGFYTKTPLKKDQLLLLGVMSPKYGCMDIQRAI